MVVAVVVVVVVIVVVIAVVIVVVTVVQKRSNRINNFRDLSIADIFWTTYFPRNLFFQTAIQEVNFDVISQ